MIDKYENTWKKWLFFTFLIMLFVQISLYTFGNDSDVMIYYVILPLVCLIFFSSLSYRQAPMLFYLNIAFFLVLFSTSIVAYIHFDLIGARSVLQVFAFLAFLVGYSAMHSLGSKSIYRLFEKLAIIFLFASLIRDFFYFDDFVDALFDGDRSGIKNAFMLTTGGPNIEVTFLGFLTLLLVNSKYFIPLIFLLLIESFAYQSRVGMILLALSMFAYILYCDNKKKASSWLLILSMFSILLFVLQGDTGVSDRLGVSAVVKEMEYASKGQGRLALWSSSINYLKSNVFGVGVGNGMALLESTQNTSFRENNVHNIYLQILIEGGVQSLVIFTVIFLYIILNNAKTLFSEPFGRVASVYFIIGCIQFVGYDVIGWLFIGMAVSTLSSREVIHDNSNNLRSDLYAT